MQVIKVLAEHVIREQYDDLPDKVIDCTKKNILDTLGAMVAGSNVSEAKTVVDMLLEWGGKGEATVFVHGQKVPAPQAAFANSLMARVLELDDHHERGGHLSVATVPAGFAIVENMRRPVSGREFIVGNALCSDLNARLRIGLDNPTIGWIGPTFAPFGIAMGGKWLSFSEDQIINAMGVAYSMISGNVHSATMGVSSAWTGSAYATFVGVMALRLAARGISGSQDPLEGTYGLYQQYGNSQYSPARIIDGLGERFEGTNASIKPYPCCKLTHNAVQGALELRKQYNLSPADVDQITISTNSVAYKVVAGEDIKYAPQTVAQAKFSLPFAVAMALERGRVFLNEFSPESLKDEAALSLCQRIHVVPDADKDRVKTTLVPVDVSIRTKSGKTLSTTVKFVKGQPENPMSYHEVAEKFRQCVAFSQAMSGDRCEEAIKLIGRLEELSDVRDVIRLFLPC